jgi:excisionase family DNA binding protein
MADFFSRQRTADHRKNTGPMNLPPSLIASFRRPSNFHDTLVEEILRPLLQKWKSVNVSGPSVLSPLAMKSCKVRKARNVKRSSEVPASDAWMTTAQVAALLGCCSETVLRLVRARRIPFAHLPTAGRIYRFNRKDIEKWCGSRQMGRAK